MGIGIVSAGKVGAVLGAALRSAGHAIVGVRAESDASAERAENLLPGIPVLPTEQIIERSELVLLAVPDDALQPVIEGIAAGGMVSPGQLFCAHLRAHGAGVFEATHRAGGYWPCRAPSHDVHGAFPRCAAPQRGQFAVTGPAPFIPIAQALVVEMGGEPVHIAEADRALYHAALAHAANHLVTIMGQSQQALASIGVEDPSHYLGPLVRAALDNALAAGETALTGPVIRGDSGTVTEHLRALREVR